MPKYFHIGQNPQELPADWMVRRGYVEPDTEQRARELATEVTPGVFVALLGIGDKITPDHRPSWGATIVVWEDWAGKGFTSRNDESADG